MSIKEAELQTAIFLVKRRKDLQGVADLLGKIAAGESWRFPVHAIELIDDKKPIAEMLLVSLATELAKTEHELTKLGVTFEGAISGWA